MFHQTECICTELLYTILIIQMNSKSESSPPMTKSKEIDVSSKWSPIYKGPGQCHSPSSSIHSEGSKKHYQPLPWHNFYDQLTYSENGTSIFRGGQDGAVFFCIHGAGQSAMSFALFAKEVKHFGTVISFDFKGHGLSKNNNNIDDLSIEALIDETMEIIRLQMQKYAQKNFILIGHSLGGSICARVTDILTNKQKQNRIVGMIIIDVVEGTAIQTIPYMNQILGQRPKNFDSIEAAIKWSIQSSVLRKVESARASIPPQLKEVEQKDKKRWVWKVNLKQSQKFWNDWFKDLSSIFLSIKIPKILVTAEKERLDKQLTIAQMQGKFKLVLLHGVGHSIQEDDYKGTAKILYQFIKDFRIPQTLAEVAHKQLIGIANFHPELAQY